MMTSPKTTHTASGIPCLEFEELGSTNGEAMRLATAGVDAPLWLRADRQDAGRGRNGRPWVSEAGNLYATLLIRPACSPRHLHHLSFVAANAAVSAVRSATADRPIPALHLKWPNDVLVDGAKLVGILPESTIDAAGRIAAVIGIGINLAHAPANLGRATTCLAVHGADIDPPAMLDRLSTAMAAELQAWDNGAGFPAIRSRWLSHALPLGTAMSVHSGSLVSKGTFAGLDDDGALILRDHSGYDHRMTFGDVFVEAAASGPGLAE